MMLWSGAAPSVPNDPSRKPLYLVCLRSGTTAVSSQYRVTPIHLSAVQHRAFPTDPALRGRVSVGRITGNNTTIARSTVA